MLTKRNPISNDRQSTVALVDCQFSFFDNHSNKSFLSTPRGFSDLRDASLVSSPLTATHRPLRQSIRNANMTNTQLREVWLEFERLNKCSVDRMLCDPLLRSRYLSLVRRELADDDEFSVLWHTVGLRKKKSLRSES